MRAGVTFSTERFVATASGFVAGLEVAHRAESPNLPDVLARYMGVAPGDAWSVALVQRCGILSHYDDATDGSAWPIPAVATATDLGAFGKAHGLLRRDAQVGDILLQYSPVARGFVRAGVVAAILGRGHWTPRRPYVEVLSIEGDRGPRGEAGGTHAVRMKRRLSASNGDRFLRWTAVDPRDGRRTLRERR